MVTSMGIDQFWPDMEMYENVKNGSINASYHVWDRRFFIQRSKKYLDEF